MSREQLKRWQREYLYGLADPASAHRPALLAKLRDANPSCLAGVGRAFHGTVRRAISGYFPVFSATLPDLAARAQEHWAKIGMDCDRGAFIERAYRVLAKSLRGDPHEVAYLDLLSLERALCLASFHRTVPLSSRAATSPYRYRVVLRSNVLDLYPDIAGIEAVTVRNPSHHDVFFAGDSQGVVARRVPAESSPLPQ